MEREFNVTGICVPAYHYLVNIEQKLKEIKKLIDKRHYFTINRGRQYGKSTTLSHLNKFLTPEYEVIPISFEAFGHDNFVNTAIFCQEFLTTIDTTLEMLGTAAHWQNESVKTFSQLSRHITKQCRDKRVVLMIDEVDKASNYRVFLDFLNMLRHKFLARADGLDFTFHSVILAGVYDIKNIKLKMISEGSHVLSSGEKEVNSPWNIAIQFEIDMSFSSSEIEGMLEDYEQEHLTGMDKVAVADEIYFYTSGYPVMVSKVCRYIDIELGKRWNPESVREAVRLLIRETDNELFKSLSQNFEGNAEIYQLMYDILILGEIRSFSSLNPAIDLAFRYGYIKEVNNRVKVSNKIFEMVMTNYFVSKDEMNLGMRLSGGLINELTRGGKFNMQLCLERFLIHWQELYTEKEVKFIEKQCRMIFLTYLKPILNGSGFCFIESALTDDRRMDLVVTYGNECFILELKTWKGRLYNEEGVGQLLGYMDKFNETRGYLLTFDFRKNPEIVPPQWRNENGKTVFEVRV